MTGNPQSGWSDELYGNLSYSPATYPPSYGSPTVAASPAPSVGYPSVAPSAYSTPAPVAAPASTGSDDGSTTPGSPYASSPYASSPYASSPYASSPYASSPYASSPYGGGSPYGSSPYSSVGSPVDYSNVSSPVDYSNVGSPAGSPGASGPSSFNQDANAALSVGRMANSAGAGIPGVSAAGDVLAIDSGIQRGGVAGYAGAALGAAKLANLGGANIPYVGPAGNVLAIYNGVKQGGVQGYSSAAVNAAELYSTASTADVAAGGAGFAGAGAATAVGEIAGPALALYALYGLDQKQSQTSPVGQAEDALKAANTQKNLVKEYESGGGPAVYGTSVQDALESAQGSYSADMAEYQWDMDPANAAAIVSGGYSPYKGGWGPSARAGGYGGGSNIGLIKKS